MALTLNTNLMALNASRNLSNHYSNLSTSVRRLSSGLRVGMAADDAAGLAIRELMRADIASLNQGVRNANDAISMIQTADGALGVIDEKLIRMKELAEQAATGTYNSDQRLMIDSEFQAMKSEITRIAMATDFNDIKILCNDTANKLYLGNDVAPVAPVDPGDPVDPTDPVVVTPGSAEWGYHWRTQNTQVTVLNADAITKDTVLHQRGFPFSITGVTGDPAILTFSPISYSATTDGTDKTVDFTINYDPGAPGSPWSVSTGNGTVDILENTDVRLRFRINDSSGGTLTGNFAMPSAYPGGSGDQVPSEASSVSYHYDSARSQGSTSWHDETGAYPGMTVRSESLGGMRFTHFIDLDNDGIDDISVNGYGSFGDSLGIKLTGAVTTGGGGGDGGGAGAGNAMLGTFDDYVTKIHFGTGNDSAEDYYYIRSNDCTAEGLGIGELSIETQAKAQRGLVAIDDAIIKKDKVRAYLGATQNRLENTVSNLQIQAENLQAAESRISDVDVATEMTEFMRNQILAQAAVSMLAQANSLPQMALSLIG